MDQTDYLSKMENLLEDSTYRTLKWDPTYEVEAKSPLLRRTVNTAKQIQ